MSEVKVDTISERTAAGGVTIDGVLIKDNIVNTDTVSEKTAAAGVTIDGVLIKDSIVNTDNIAEKTATAGVTIDGVLIKDGVATFQTAAGSPLVFEGATANDHETTFAFTDPTADRTITFPDASFTVPTSSGGMSAHKFYFGKTISDATATTTVTGVGFTPKVVYIFVVASPASEEYTTMGFSVPSSHPGMAHGAAGWTRTDSRTIRIYNTMSGNDQRSGYVSSFDSDGFTVTWDAKVGTPTGTLACYGIAWG
jgi:hypothetical protein